MTADDDAVAASIDAHRKRERIMAWTGAVGLALSSAAIGGAIAYAAIELADWWLAAALALAVVVRVAADLANSHAREHRSEMWRQAVADARRRHASEGDGP